MTVVLKNIIDTLSKSQDVIVNPKNSFIFASVISRHQHLVHSLFHIEYFLGLFDQRHVDHVTPEVEGALALRLVLAELGDQVGGPFDAVRRRRKCFVNDRELRRVDHLGNIIG